MMKVVSWNYRGLGGSSKVEALKYIVKTEKPDILLIQETKMPKFVDASSNIYTHRIV